MHTGLETLQQTIYTWLQSKGVIKNHIFSSQLEPNITADWLALELLGGA
jgi:hypothetical protein